MATNVAIAASPLEEAAVLRRGRRLSLGAIGAGMVIALAVQLVMAASRRRAY